MRINHIESRLEQQLTLKELITHLVDNLTKVGYSNVTSQRVQARLSALKEIWEKFSLVHEAITLAMTKISNEEKLQLRTHSYFSEQVYSTTYECYLEATEKMISFFESISESINEIPNSSSQNSQLPVYFHHARLPRIDIPKFNGSLSDWLSS